MRYAMQENHKQAVYVDRQSYVFSLFIESINIQQRTQKYLSVQRSVWYQVDQTTTQQHIPEFKWF